MIVLRESHFYPAIENLLVSIKSSATDGNGLRILMPIDVEKFASEILNLVGNLTYGEVPYLLPDSETLPVKAIHLDNMLMDLTGFFADALERSKTDER